ncbi:MAG TPA: hypothetical protein VHC73_06430 [Vitreimonas sp.]|jgi:hypothetical protein|nr:hypothetical protein [Vitreimonas sp.]
MMIALGFGDVRETLANVFNTHLRWWAGAAFVALAMLSIQYEEVIAPGVSRISDAWTSTTAKLTNLSL